jgi:drug/metabolite transporter (DMT)-like permease
MIAVLLGLFAALCWSIHDLIARMHAEGVGPFRMAMWVMLIGAALLAGPVLYRGIIGQGDMRSIMFALLLGASYAFAVGGLFKAFSLAPISIVGPFTAGYPALVVVWGLVNGLTPSPFEWLAILMIVAGAVIVGRFGPDDGGIKSIAPGKLGYVIAACAVASFGFAAAVVLGQTASPGLGEFETTFISRFPAALMLLPLALKDRAAQPAMSRGSWWGVAVMAGLDVLAVSGINYSGQFDNKEFAAMGITAYGALSVLLAMIFLREKVSGGQWAGIAMIMVGVGILGWPG